MTDFLRLVRSDYYGIFKRKKLILSVLIIGWALLVLANYAYSDEGGFSFNAPAVSMIVFVFLFLFAAIAVSSIVNNNYSCGLAAKKLATGCSREKIYLASLCTALLMCLTLWVIFLVPVILAGYLASVHNLAEYAEYASKIVEHDPEQAAAMMERIAAHRAENAELLARWIGYSAAGLLSVASVCAIFTFISFSIRSGFGVRLLCLVLVLVAVFATIAVEFLPTTGEYQTITDYDQFGNIIQFFDVWISTGYEKNIFSFLVFGYLKFFPPMLWLAPDDPFGGVWTYIVVAIVMFAASTAAGIAIFRKKNLK